MSKKVAEGLDALVLEVTYGKAANMKTEQEARNLAQIMVNIIIKCSRTLTLEATSSSK